MKTMGHRDVKTAVQYQHPELEIVALRSIMTQQRRNGRSRLSYGTLDSTPKTPTPASD